MYSFFQGDSNDIGHESRLLIPCHFSGVFRPSGRLTCKLWGAGLINADKVTDESDVVIHEGWGRIKKAYLSCGSKVETHPDTTVIEFKMVSKLFT